jgi:hypothetical protein
MDVKTAFLTADVQEKIYVQQPPGYVVKGYEGWVLELCRSLYGLRQAPRNFNQEFSAFLLTLGLTPCPADPCVFYRYDPITNAVCFLSLYVDDIVLTGNDAAYIEKVRSGLHAKYTMSADDAITMILGMNIQRDRSKRSLRIHHDVYIRDLLSRFDISDTSYPYATPAADDTYTQYIEAVFRQDARTRVDYDYRAVVGCLVYLANTTRPDIANITRFLSGFVTSWTDIHCLFAQRVLKYLSLTPSLGLHYCFDGADETKFGDVVGGVSFGQDALVKDLEAYTDASWADNYSDATSTSGSYVTWSGCLLAWKSVKQRVIATSSMESEFIAMNECLSEIKSLVFLLENLSSTHFRATMDSASQDTIDLVREAARIHVKGDNMAAIKIGNQDVNTKRSRMVNVKFHLLKEAVVDKLIDFRYVCSKENIADIFTKCLSKAPFLYLRSKFMS